MKESKQPRYLEQWYDPSVSPLVDFNHETYEEDQLYRIHQLMALAEAVRSVPRRLPGATAKELAVDKKLSRKLHVRWRECARLWHGQPADYDEYLMEMDDLSTINGIPENPADLDWLSFLQSHNTHLNMELRKLAATALNATERSVKRSCNRFSNRFINEIYGIGQAFEEITEQKAHILYVISE